MGFENGPDALPVKAARPCTSTGKLERDSSAMTGCHSRRSVLAKENFRIDEEVIAPEARICVAGVLSEKSEM